jgi:hypothetical protein
MILHPGIDLLTWLNWRRLTRRLGLPHEATPILHGHIQVHAFCSILARIHQPNEFKEQPEIAQPKNEISDDPKRHSKTVINASRFIENLEGDLLPYS